MLRRGILPLSEYLDIDVDGLRPATSRIRLLTAFGLTVGLLDVITTAEHILVPPLSDGNPLLMAVGNVSPVLAYSTFVCWFCLVAGVAVTRDDGLGYGADVYLLAAFGLGGIANTAYFLFGTMLFKNLVGQFPVMSDLYVVVLAPLGSLLVGVWWARRT